MDLKTFFEHFDTLAEAPNGIQRLRELILDMAVRGKLVPQDPEDKPAQEILEKVKALKVETLTKKRKTKKVEVLEPPEDLELPDSWVWTNLQELGAVNPKNDLPDDLSVGFVPMQMVPTDYRQGVEFEERSWQLVKKGFTHFSNGDVGIAKITPCFQNGKAVVFQSLPNGYGAGTTELLIFRPLQETLIPHYILLFLKSRTFVDEGVDRMTGTAGQQRVPRDYFAGCPVPLPPLAEQKRIVAKVDELMALCDALETAQHTRNTLRQSLRASALDTLMNATSDTELDTAWSFVCDHWDTFSYGSENLTDLRQLILKLAVEGKLIEAQADSIDAQEKILETIKSQRLSLQLSKKDEKRIIEEFQATTDETKNKGSHITLPARCVCDFITKGTTPAKSELMDQGDIPYIKVYNIVNNNLNFSYKPAFISQEVHENKLKRSKVLAGDVLMNIVGPPLGKVAIVPNTYPEWNLNQALAIFRPMPAIDRKFLYYTLSSFSTLRTVLNETRGTAGQDNLSLEQCRDLRIPLFSLAEQKRIVAKVDELMQLCDQLEENLRQQHQQATALVASTISHLAA